MTKPRKTRAHNLFKLSKGPAADALRGKLAAMPPLDFEAVAGWIAAQPEAGVILRAHALRSGLIEIDEEAGVLCGRSVALARQRFERMRP